MNAKTIVLIHSMLAEKAENADFMYKKMRDNLQEAYDMEVIDERKLSKADKRMLDNEFYQKMIFENALADFERHQW